MHTKERRALAALWSVRGVGPMSVGLVRERWGELGELLERPCDEWAREVKLRPDAGAHLSELSSLAERADWLERRLRAMRAQVVFSGDDAWPTLLDGIPKAPPLLFCVGPGAKVPPRRRVAMVGSRQIDGATRRRVMDIAAQATSEGLGVVSGGAFGVDQSAHYGALESGGETWAVLASGLDEIDAGQVPVCRRIVEAGHTIWSEFPPGFRANKSSFTLRNRLISGMAEATVLFRAAIDSGALHTAKACLSQRRPLLAAPGDPWNQTAEGTNQLIRSGQATPFADVSDLLRAAGLEGSLSPTTAVDDFATDGLSETARAVWRQLISGPADFETLTLSFPSLPSGALSAALVELEVLGAVIHKGGRRYEKR